MIIEIGLTIHKKKKIESVLNAEMEIVTFNVDDGTARDVSNFKEKSKLVPDLPLDTTVDSNAIVGFWPLGQSILACTLVACFQWHKGDV